MNARFLPPLGHRPLAQHVPGAIIVQSLSYLGAGQGKAPNLLRSPGNVPAALRRVPAHAWRRAVLTAPDTGANRPEYPSEGLCDGFANPPPPDLHLHLAQSPSSAAHDGSHRGRTLGLVTHRALGAGRREEPEVGEGHHPRAAMDLAVPVAAGPLGRQHVSDRHGRAGRNRLDLFGVHHHTRPLCPQHSPSGGLSDLQEPRQRLDR